MVGDTNALTNVTPKPGEKKLPEGFDAMVKLLSSDIKDLEETVLEWGIQEDRKKQK